MTTILLLFSTMSINHQLPTNLLSSVCYVESNHRPAAVNFDDGVGNSLGICQIKMIAAQQVGFKGTEQELLKPEVNIEYAAKFLSYQLKRYNGNITKAIIAYNRGNAKDLIRTDYSDKVISQWRNQNMKAMEVALEF